MRVFVIIAAITLVANIFGCSRQTQSKSHSDTVRNALTRLLTQPLGAFVIIEEPLSGKFVQFGGSKDEPLWLDLPSQTLSPDEMTRAKAVFAEFGYAGAEVDHDPAGQDTNFIVKFGTDVDKATELAVAVLHRVYKFGDDTKLKLTEGC